MSKGWASVRAYFLGSTKTIELVDTDVDELIDSYQSSATTDDLFGFGKLLLTSTEEQVSALDNKATSLVGFSGAVLAFLVTRLTALADLSHADLIFLVGISSSAALGCVFAWRALRAARDWKALGEATWLPTNPVMESSDKLKRFWLKAIHGMNQHNRRIANQKADEVIMAQLCIGAAAFLLAVMLGLSAFKALVV